MTSASRLEEHEPGVPGPHSARATAPDEPAEPSAARDGAEREARVEPAPSRAAERAAREKKREKKRQPKTWKPRRSVAGLALMFAMFGLSMSWFMPWAAPASLVGVILGVIAVARPWDDRAAGGWALGLGIAGLAGSAFWAWQIWSALQEVGGA